MDDVAALPPDGHRVDDRVDRQMALAPSNPRGGIVCGAHTHRREEDTMHGGLEGFAPTRVEHLHVPTLRAGHIGPPAEVAAKLEPIHRRSGPTRVACRDKSEPNVALPRCASHRLPPSNKTAPPTAWPPR